MSSSDVRPPAPPRAPRLRVKKCFTCVHAGMFDDAPEKKCLAGLVPIPRSPPPARPHPPTLTSIEGWPFRTNTTCVTTRRSVSTTNRDDDVSVGPTVPTIQTGTRGHVHEFAMSEGEQARANRRRQLGERETGEREQAKAIRRGRSGDREPVGANGLSGCYCKAHMLHHTST